MEIIVVDDNSSDKTIEIIEKLNCSRIHIYKNEENLGYIKNFYKAISLTQGKYVFLADQDDIWGKRKSKANICRTSEFS